MLVLSAMPNIENGDGDNDMITDFFDDNSGKGDLKRFLNLKKTFYN